MKNGDFKISRLDLNDHGFSYSTFQVSGYLNGERVRKKFKTRDEAVGEKGRLEIAAANGVGEIRALNTRLTLDQVAEAEAAFYYVIAKDSTELARAAWMFWGTTIVALSAARCAKKETDRKIRAIVRRLEDKGLL